MRCVMTGGLLRYLTAAECKSSPRAQKMLSVSAALELLPQTFGWKVAILYVIGKQNKQTKIALL